MHGEHEQDIAGEGIRQRTAKDGRPVPLPTNEAVYRESDSCKPELSEDHKRIAMDPRHK